MGAPTIFISNHMHQLLLHYYDLHRSGGNIASDACVLIKKRMRRDFALSVTCGTLGCGNGCFEFFFSLGKKFYRHQPGEQCQCRARIWKLEF